MAEYTIIYEDAPSSREDNIAELDNSSYDADSSSIEDDEEYEPIIKQSKQNDEKIGALSDNCKNIMIHELSEYGCKIITNSDKANFSPLESPLESPIKADHESILCSPLYVIPSHLKSDQKNVQNDIQKNAQKNIQKSAQNRRINSPNKYSPKKRNDVQKSLPDSNLYEIISERPLMRLRSAPLSPPPGQQIDIVQFDDEKIFTVNKIPYGDATVDILIMVHRIEYSAGNQWHNPSFSKKTEEILHDLIKYYSDNHLVIIVGPAPFNLRVDKYITNNKAHYKCNYSKHFLPRTEQVPQDRVAYIASRRDLIGMPNKFGIINLVSLVVVIRRPSLQNKCSNLLTSDYSALLIRPANKLTTAFPTIETSTIKGIEDRLRHAFCQGAGIKTRRQITIAPLANLICDHNIKILNHWCVVNHRWFYTVIDLADIIFLDDNIAKGCGSPIKHSPNKIANILNDRVNKIAVGEMLAYNYRGTAVKIIPAGREKKAQVRVLHKYMFTIVLSKILNWAIGELLLRKITMPRYTLDGAPTKIKFDFIGDKSYDHDNSSSREMDHVWQLAFGSARIY